MQTFERLYSRQNATFSLYKIFSFRNIPAMDLALEPTSLARTPRPWLTREAGECAFPVGGEGKWTMACCNRCGSAAYCSGHARIMRGPRLSCVSVFETNVMKSLEEG
jgi:hypothetical protein